VSSRPGQPQAEERIRELLSLPTARYQYLQGTADPDTIAPDGWTLDQHFLDLPGRQQTQADLAFDYHTNVEPYPCWQAWLCQHQPPTLIVWGRNDPLFLEAGVRAYLRDLPAAELRLFETGHFALEERLGEIAPLSASFLDRAWRRRLPSRPRRAGQRRPRAQHLRPDALPHTALIPLSYRSSGTRKADHP
jgi:pimeloyl-ACP methyl ester carboxylesterase